MTLRRRLLLLLGGVVLIASAALWGVLEVVFAWANRETLRSEYAIKREFADHLSAWRRADLQPTASGWAVWEEMFAYMEAPDPTFEATYFNEEGVRPTKMDLLVVVRPDETFAFSWVRERGQAHGRPMRPEEQQQILARIHAPPQAWAGSEGLLSIAGGAALIHAEPIAHPNSSLHLPPRGWVVVGMWYQNAVLERFEAATGAQCQLLPYTPGHTEEIAVFQERVVSEHLLYDEQRAPIAVLEAAWETEPFQPLFQVEKALVAVVVVLASGAWFVLYMTLERWITRPLAQLREDLRLVQTDGQLPQKQEIPEITELRQTINGYLRAVAKHVQSEAVARKTTERAKRTTEAALQEAESAKQEALNAQRASEEAREAAEIAKRTAEQALDARSRFLAMMSHEIRTPLNAVLGYVELLLTSALQDEQREWVRSVQMSGRTLLNVINDILDFSKLEAGKLQVEQEEVDLQLALEDVVSLLASQAWSKGITLIAEPVAAAAAVVKADPFRVRQVLTNLVGNAIKFTPHGSVTVRATLHDASVQIEVSDTGVGISQEAIGRLFQPFSQADASTTRRFGGTGLGLAISRGLVEQMGGEIRVTSKEGEGTTFSFTLPALATREERLEGPPIALVGPRSAWIAAIQAALEQDQIPVARFLRFEEAEATLSRGGVALWYDSGLERVYQGKVARFFPTGAKVVRLAETTSLPLWMEACVPPLALRGPHVRRSALQAALRAEQALPPASPHLPNAAQTGRRVLVVDDNPINLRLARKMLEKLGYSCGEARNGKEAVDQRFKEAWDLILMDCQMPVMDGYEATQVIRNREVDGAHAQIVALTANAMPEDREKCLACGMDGFLTKPFTLESLRATLETYVEAPPAPPA